MTSTIDKVRNSSDTLSNQASTSSFIDRLLNTGSSTLRQINDYNLRKLEIKAQNQQRFSAGASVAVTQGNHPSQTSFFTTKHIEYIGLGLLAIVAAVVILKGK